MDISIVIPTYNESKNLPILIERIVKVLEESGIEGQIIVVDDDSPDETWKTALELKNRYANLEVLRRRDKRGLSSAVLDGFAMSKSPILGVMDADLSHPPEKVPELVEPLINGEADITIGSRYIDEGGIEKWSIGRKIYSKIATLLVLGLTDVKDPMSGFFFLRRDVIENKKLNPLGFKIGLEILVRGEYENVIEVPILFGDRIHGESKLGGGVVLDYLVHLSNLYIYKYILRK
jgi:dolichol-phosphate mannosyltransferase